MEKRVLVLHLPLASPPLAGDDRIRVTRTHMHGWDDDLRLMRSGPGLMDLEEILLSAYVKYEKPQGKPRKDPKRVSPYARDHLGMIVA